MTWSLPVLLSGLHEDIETKLSVARKSFQHSGTKGDASESIWLELLNTYLPKRYCAEKAHVVDSDGNFSQQIDVVIFDRQYTPFVFNFQDQLIIPAESVYAVFEAKQTVNATYVQYAKDKASTVRGLNRTSLPIPHAGGTYPPKAQIDILAGILALDSNWSPALGESFTNALITSNSLEKLDLACVASHGLVVCDESGVHRVTTETKAATAFLLELIAKLQTLGTVPMIDVRAYARWLSVPIK
jgi:hypothetical protein